MHQLIISPIKEAIITPIWDRSLVTGKGAGGGLQIGRGGANEILPLQKGAGVEKVSAMLKGWRGGYKKISGSFNTEA